jgi:sugar transferase (PEP-CTERM/EpsH1 system associated)
MRILTLNHAVPFPPIGGGDLRTFHLLRALARRHEVTVVGFSCDDPREPAPFPVETAEVDWDWPPLYRAMHGGDPEASRAAYEELLASDEPWFVSWLASAAMDDLLRRVGRRGFDLALVEHSNMARYLPALPARLPKVLDFVDLHTLMRQRKAEADDGPERDLTHREAERTRRFESRVASRASVCLAVSEAEAEAARRLLGAADVRVVPNGVDTTRFRPAEGAGEDGYLLFTGTMDYAPNVAAAEHFVAQVWPLIRREVPGVTFHVVGARPTPAVLRLAGDGVEVHGQVPDMGPYFRQAAVVVVPLLHGGGTRLKILEAAASARAVVSTRLGAEGLDLADGRDLLLADAPADFARAVVGLLRDPFRRAEMGRQARIAAERYDWEGIGNTLLGIVEEAVSGRYGCAVSGQSEELECAS